MASVATAIVKRDFRCDFSVAPRLWHGGGVGPTSVFDALSISFPKGERAFIRSVFHYRDRIDDPDLLIAMIGFGAQESVHTREHEKYNARLEALGCDVAKLSARQSAMIRWIEEDLGPEANLAITSSMEHMTAVMADQLTAEPRYLEDADPAFRDLWLWHSMEEAEHRAVAFDVLSKVRPGYFFRCRYMALSLLLFVWLMVGNLATVMRSHGARAADWKGALSYLWFSPGLLRRVMLPTLAYFRPGFRPAMPESAGAAHLRPAADSAAAENSGVARSAASG